MKKKHLMACVALLASAPVMATDSGFYAGAELMRIDAKPDPVVIDEDQALPISNFRLNGAGITGGYRFNQYFAVEGRYASSNTQGGEIGGVPVEFKLEHLVTGLAKAIWPASSQIEPYAVIGATYGRSRAAVPGVATESGSDTQFSYGVGVHLWAALNWGAKLEFLRYEDSSDGRVEAYQIGFLYRF